MKMNRDKYKRGDILRTRERLIHRRFYDGLYFTNNMRSNKLTIKNTIHHGRLVYYKVCENKYIYSEKMMKEVDYDKENNCRRKRSEKSNTRTTKNTKQ